MQFTYMQKLPLTRCHSERKKNGKKKKTPKETRGNKRQNILNRFELDQYSSERDFEGINMQGVSKKYIRTLIRHR